MRTLSNNDIARAIYLVSKNKKELELKGVNNKVAQFLVRKRLLSKAPDILERLEKIVNHEDGRITVKVSSAMKLREESKRELASFLKKRYGAKEAIFEEKVDEKLLGGMRMEVNDEIIDLTAKNKIKELQEHLIRKL